MSLANTSTETCKHCHERLTDFYAPGYCSEECYHRYQGQKALNTIKHDHTHCFQCGQELKTIEEPTDEALVNIQGFHSTTSVVGFQYRNQWADVGEILVNDTPGKETYSTGTTCGRCGSTNLFETFPEDRDRHLFEYASRILEALEEKEDEHHKEFNHDVYFQSLLTDADIALAVGKSIEA